MKSWFMFFTFYLMVTQISNAQSPWPTPPPPPNTVGCEVFCNGAKMPACNLYGTNESKVYERIRDLIVNKKCFLRLTKQTIACDDLSSVLIDKRSACYNYKSVKSMRMSELEGIYIDVHHDAGSTQQATKPAK